MNCTTGRRFLCAALFISLVSVAGPLARADQWTAPTPEELSMTSQPEVPGAPAVYLLREETTEDNLHMFSVYVRVKVLTERGKEYGNVELGYASVQYGGGYTINDIAGRTIHPDGSIVPFTGKPYEKLVEKTQGTKYMAKIFSMPDVSVGSIIEYRYKLRYDDNYYISPRWFIQSALYLRKGHYMWRPTNRQLISNRGQATSSIAWFPVLPAGTELKSTRLPAVGMADGQFVFELNVHDIPPAPEGEYMPPTSSLTYRVLFYYTAYRTSDEFWKKEGNYWAKQSDKFIGPGSEVRAAVQQLAAPSDTQDQKLRKFYAAVMKLENTDFTREHTTAEEKAAGLKEIHTSDDIWTRKRGSSDQLAQLFVAMARAAGMKAYVMAVTNRDHNLFIQGYLSFGQLDDVIAIVTVDGKEQFFDPGSRYCPYGHLEWKHSMAAGIRETDNGTVIDSSPGQAFTASRIQRVANLNMDQQGIVTGIVKMTYIGAPALHNRQLSLRGDSTSTERQLRVDLEQLMPGNMEVKVASIEKTDDYESPLVVNYNIHGAIGSPTGKRLLIPGDIFEMNSKPKFPGDKREIPVYFPYAHMVQDAIRINFPPTIKVESLPAADTQQFQGFASYNMTTQSAPTSFTVRRNYSLAEIIYKADEYTGLRSFYNKMETKDQETVVLTAAPVGAAKPTTGTN